jgi:hypothetical protein
LDYKEDQVASNNNSNSKNGSAYEWLISQFTSLGVPELGKVALGIYKSARTSDDFLTQIRATPEYAKRFAGNIARQKAGLPVIDENVYLAQESSYRQVLSSYGLPKGFYDNPTDFTNWIAKDVSPAEIGSRAQVASQWVNSADPGLRASLKSFYGVNHGDMVAYALDSNVALPVLQKRAAAAELGAAASDVHLNLGRNFSENLVDKGVSQSTGQQAFGEVAREQPTANMLAGLSNVNLTTKDQVNAKLDLDPNASNKVRTLASQERGRFSGQNAGTNSLNGQVSGSY